MSNASTEMPFNNMASMKSKRNIGSELHQSAHRAKLKNTKYETTSMGAHQAMQSNFSSIIKTMKRIKRQIEQMRDGRSEIA